MTRSDKELQNQLKIRKLQSLYYKVKLNFPILRIMSFRAFCFLLKVSKNRNDFMKRSFLPKYQQNFIKDFCPSL